MKHIGNMRVQVDRWPLETESDDYILSIIIVVHYPKKPQLSDIINALQNTAADILRGGGNGKA